MDFLGMLITELKEMTAPDDHARADEILCEVLHYLSGWINHNEQGAAESSRIQELIAAYRNVPKWFG